MWGCFRRVSSGLSRSISAWLPNTCTSCRQSYLEDWGAWFSAPAGVPLHLNLCWCKEGQLESTKTVEISAILLWHCQQERKEGQSTRQVSDFSNREFLKEKSLPIREPNGTRIDSGMLHNAVRKAGHSATVHFSLSTL
jgi:hypothetical protein